MRSGRTVALRRHVFSSEASRPTSQHPHLLLHGVYRWRRQMLEEPVAVAVGLDRWPAVRAWLSNTHVPLASLQLTAADGRAAQQVILCSRSRFGGC